MVESTAPTGQRPGRSRRRPATREHLARLTAARDRLDAEQEARRRREDELFEEFAAVAVARDDVVAEQDRRLADLDRQRGEIEHVTAAALGDLEHRQMAVLHQLQQLGRTVEQLAELVDIPVKKLRPRLRAHRAATTGPATSTNSPEPTPSAPPAGPPEPPAAGPPAPAAAAATTV